MGLFIFDVFAPRLDLNFKLNSFIQILLLVGPTPNPDHGGGALLNITDWEKLQLFKPGAQPLFHSLTNLFSCEDVFVFTFMFAESQTPHSAENTSDHLNETNSKEHLDSETVSGKLC